MVKFKNISQKILKQLILSVKFNYPNDLEGS